MIFLICNNISMLQLVIECFFLTLITCILFTYRETQYKKKKQKPPKCKKKSLNIRNGLELQKVLIDHAIQSGGNNIATRHLQETAAKLDYFDKNTPLTQKSFKLHYNDAMSCYGCGKITRKSHPVYIFSCNKCGTKFQKKRYFSRNLNGHVSLVIGCRTKLGHQVTLKLLRAGSVVIGTTRYPEKASDLFKEYDDFNEWCMNFDIYENGLDLDSDNLQEKFGSLSTYILERYHKLDNLIICAAQTIRVREKEKNKLSQTDQFNRYGDAKFVEEKYINSWKMTIEDITQKETEECMRINAVAPALLIQSLINVMKNSNNTPYIISVHAREGIFQLEKGPTHIHTNMAKAALHMMTRTLIEDKTLVTHLGNRFSIHGCDPGWISVDEYYENNRPYIIPPLDEIDGAARILYPLFRKLKSSRKTQRHFEYSVY